MLSRLVAGQLRGIDPSAYRRLAVAVLHRAADDAAGLADTIPYHERDHARRFLCGQTDRGLLVFWCELAGLDVLSVERASRQRYERAA